MSRHTTGMSLFTKMIIAVVGGIALGIAFQLIRLAVGDSSSEWQLINQLLLVDITAGEGVQGIGLLNIVGTLFMKAMQLAVVPLVFASLALAVGAVDDLSKLGRIARKMLACFAFFYAVCVVAAQGVAMVVRGSGAFNVRLPEDISAGAETIDAYNPFTIITDLVPNNFVAAFSDNSGVLAVIVIALFVGIGLLKMPEEAAPLKKLLESINSLLSAGISFLISHVGPFAIFCMLARALAVYGTDYLYPALAYVLTGMLTPIALFFILYPATIWVTCRLNPIPFIRKCAKTAILASATNSSAAALPVNMRTCETELGCGKSTTSLILPTGMTIHMNGTVVMQSIATIFVATVAGVDIQPYHLLIAGLVAVTTAISTPPVPMAGTVLVSVILGALGFTNDACMLAYAVVLAVNYPIGMAFMPMNVVGDAACCMVVSNSEGELDREVYRS